MSSVAAEEAIARAKRIAAKLSGQTEAVPSVDDNSSAPLQSSAVDNREEDGGERKRRRKRWAKDSPSSSENAVYHSMALPSQVLEAAAKAAPVLTSHQDATNGTNEQYNGGDFASSNPNNVLATLDSRAEAPTRSKSTYTPKPVAQILGLGGAGGHYGPRSDGNQELSLYGGGGQMVEEIIHVPNGVVGYIIGRGGENISSMQRKTSCKVQIQKESEMNAEAPNKNKQERKITLIGPDQSAVSECRVIIENMVAERREQLVGHRSASSGTGSNADTSEEKFRAALAKGHAHVQIQIPDKDVGLVIGRQGINIKNIQDRTTALIQIPNKADEQNPQVRTCNITCVSMEGAQRAKQMVQDILDKHAMYHGNRITGTTGTSDFSGMSANTMGIGAQHSISVAIPNKDVGIVIGRGGCVIKEMQSKTSCRIQIPSHPTPGQPNRIATITGTEEGCRQVQQMIENIIINQSSSGIMSGNTANGAFNVPSTNQDAYLQQNFHGATYHNGNAGMVQGATAQQHGTGAQDYSAEWASYYAAQAMAETNNAASTTTNHVADRDLSDPTAYYDDFWRYAALYGEAAAREYYKAWSPPEGTSNPNTVSAVQHSTGALQQHAAVAPQQPSNGSLYSADTTSRAVAGGGEAQETSVRKVSNLPAWMSKA